jgi:hypothetical protein
MYQKGKIELVSWSNWSVADFVLLGDMLILFNCKALALYFSKNADVIFACSPCICFR